MALVLKDALRHKVRVLAAAYDCRGAMDTRRAMEALVCALKFEFEVAW